MAFAGLGLIALIVIAVVLTLGLALSRRGVSKRTDAPCCGGCGYELAPNPAGLTVCPECGRDFLAVGILAPQMKLGRRASPIVPLGIAWLVLIAVGLIPLSNQLTQSFSRTLTTVTATHTFSGQGPLASIRLVSKRVQLQDEPAPDTLTTEVTLTGDGEPVVFTVDQLSRTISAAPKESPLADMVGKPWDDAAATRAMEIASGQPQPDPASVKRLRHEVTDSGERSNYASIGSAFRSSSTTTSSTGGIMTYRNARQAAQAQVLNISSSSSNTTAGTTRVPVIGPFRGQHWVLLLTGIVGLTLAAGGLWVIRLAVGHRER